MPLFADGSHPLLLFSDGACSGNPGKGGWGVVIVTPDAEVKELGGGVQQTTNNQMELMGAIVALETVENRPEPAHMFTDSVYVIRGITQWIWGWRKRGWKTAEGADVANREYWERLSRAVARRGPAKPIHWHWLRGHAGIPGNERCDEIAVGFTKGHKVALYNGTLLRYGVAIMDVPDDTSLPEMKPKEEKKAAAHSYLSVVDGKPARHASWTDCERRVKGRSGAKFKKAMTQADEASILAAWGYSERDLS